MRQIKIKVNQISNNRVPVIKAIRILTGVGLKEAKDASELVGQEQIFQRSMSITDYEFMRERQVLLDNDVEVLEGISDIMKILKSAAANCILFGEEELGNDILQIVLKDKLSRNPNE